MSSSYLSQSACEESKYTQKTQHEIWKRGEGEYMLQKKYDGVSCIIDCRNGTALTRVGTEFRSVQHIVNACIMAFGRDAIVFGELWKAGVKQSTINGQAMGHSPAPTLDLVVFDVISGLDYERGFSNDGYRERLDHIIGCLYTAVGAADFPLKLVEYYNPGTWTNAAQMAREVAGLGFDGMIRRWVFAPWLPGKDKLGYVIKDKPTHTYDLECVDIEEGLGRNAGRVGAIVVRYRNGVLVRVSGMSDAEREAWWLDPTKVVGKIIEIKALGESSNGSLREPRIINIRTDKDKPDY